MKDGLSAMIQRNRRAIFCAICIPMILWDLVRRLDFGGQTEINTQLYWLQCAMAGAVVSRLDLRRDKWSWPLLLFFPLVILLNAIHGLDVVSGSAATVLRAALMLGVSGVGLLLEPKQVKKWLLTFIGLWTALYAALSLVGIWAAFTGTTIPSLRGASVIGLDASFGRLRLFTYYTIVAEELCTTILMVGLAIVLTRRKWARAVWIAALVPIVIALALTDGRNGIICTGGGIGLGGIALLWPRLAAKWPGKKAALKRLSVAAAVLIVCVVVVYIAVSGIVPAFSAVQGLRAGRLPVAGALADSGDVLNGQNLHRGDSDLLNGRTNIWRAGVQVILDHPSVLLIGTSVAKVKDVYADYYDLAGIKFEHMHNILFQCLIEFGLLGFGLFVWFLVMLAKASWQALTSLTLPLWARLVPIPAITLIVGEMTECSAKLSYKNPSNLIFMVFASLTFAAVRWAKQERQA